MQLAEGIEPTFCPQCSIGCPSAFSCWDQHATIGAAAALEAHVQRHELWRAFRDEATRAACSTAPSRLTADQSPLDLTSLPDTSRQNKMWGQMGV